MHSRLLLTTMMETMQSVEEYRKHLDINVKSCSPKFLVLFAWGYCRISITNNINNIQYAFYCQSLIVEIYYVCVLHVLFTKQKDSVAVNVYLIYFTPNYLTCVSTCSVLVNTHYLIVLSLVIYYIILYCCIFIILLYSYSIKLYIIL